MRAALTLAALALVACVPPIPSGRYACATDTECPPGLVCRVGVCRVLTADGGVPVPADGGMPPAPDAAVDGGTGPDAGALDPDAGVILDPAGGPDLAVGARHASVVTSRGTVLAWGDNSMGALGATTSGLWSAMPIVVPGVPAAHAVCAGTGFTCALSRDGAVWCWGAADVWQVGGDARTPAAPAAVAGVSGATALACGARHACAGGPRGVTCWGADELGQAGAAPTPRVAPHLVFADPVVALTAGSTHTCALDASGAVRCWGGHGMGQLGPGAPAPSASGFSATPVLVPGLVATAIAAGAQHTCAADVDGSVSCWGRGDGGRLGVSASGAHPALVRLTLASGAAHVAGGDELSCAASASGPGLWCWGSLAYGQLGIGGAISNGIVQTPTAVASMDSPVGRVEAGAGFGCALTDGAVACWGLNDRGQLGDGTTTSRSAPVGVLLPELL